jgi:hypothetical protein
MIAAWHACDHHALHTACGLKVSQSSPLPLEIDIGGVDETIEQQYVGPRVAWATA